MYRLPDNVIIGVEDETARAGLYKIETGQCGSQKTILSHYMIVCVYGQNV